MDISSFQKTHRKAEILFVPQLIQTDDHFYQFL